MMFRREFLATMASAVGVLGLPGCTDRRGTGPYREISVSLSDRLASSPVYLAEESGYFRDAGFLLNIVRFSMMQAVPLLAGGRLDVGFGGTSSPLIHAVARGMPLRIVAGREVVNPDCGDSYTLYAHRQVFAGGPIDLRRLRGRRFSVRIAGITEFILDLFLDHIGMSEDEVERVDLPLNESLTALASGRIDGMFDVELSRSPLVASPDIVSVWRLADVLPFHQFSFIVFGESMLNGGLESGAGFLAAYLKGGQDFLAGRTPDFMREFATANGLHVERTISECRETFSPDGSIDLASVQRIIDWSVRRGYATEPMEASRLVDTRFIEEARRLLDADRWRTAAGIPARSSP